VRYPVKAINVLKAHGRSAQESQLLKGYAINLARAAQGMPRRWEREGRGGSNDKGVSPDCCTCSACWLPRLSEMMLDY
jgi:hypothetical protein